MIIYMNKIAKFKYSRWQKIRNMFLPRLYGFNVVYDRSGKDPEVMPVYIPFARMERGEGMAVIEISAWSENALVVMLFTRWPFVYFARGGGIQLDILKKGEDDEWN